MQGFSQSQPAPGHVAAALPEYLTAAMSAPHAVSGVPASSTEGSAFDGPASGPSDTWTSSASLPSFVYGPGASVQQQMGVGPQARLLYVMIYPILPSCLANLLLICHQNQCAQL